VLEDGENATKQLKLTVPIIVNFRDENGLPSLDDEAFTAAIS
jgi:hypothetical protein